MTNAERIEAHNAELRACIDLAESLPDATGGGTTTPTQEKNVEITENGTIDVVPDDGYTLSKVGVSVNVPIPDGYIQPSGTLAITQNGEHNAREYEKVAVNVPIPDGYIQPSGELEITENGTHDVTQYVTVNVNVPSSGGGGDLPAGYSRVDYIEFTGGQLVDTGIIGNQDTQIRTSFTWGNDKQNHVYGCASSDNTASITSYMNGSWRFGDKTATKTIQKNNTLLPYSSCVNKTMIGITGSNTAISGVSDFETVATLLLGGARTATGELPASGIVGRVFDFRVWDGDTPVMKMIPVTDGQQYRFWDAVSQSFFDSITDTPLEGGNL
jgi:hypothetical protein